MPRYTASGVYPGANRMVSAFANAGGRYRQAFGDETKSLAVAENQRAEAEKHAAEAVLLKARGSYLAPENRTKYLSESAGVPEPLAQKFSEYIKGERAAQIDPQELQQAADQGTPAPAATMPVTELAAEAKPFEEKLVQAIRGLSGIRSSSTVNPQQVAAAAGEYQDQGLTDKALAGGITPEELGAVKAAISGKPLYSDAGGRVLGRFSGALDEEGDQAQANVDLTGARSDAATALAEQRRNPTARGGAAKPPARVAVIDWAMKNLGMTAEQAAVWEGTTKNKSPQALFLDVRGKLATANPALARDPAKLDAAASAAVQAASAFANQPPATAAPATGAARPTTQAQFDALPKGAEYIDPDDGKRYKKP